jgi:hypothetical protein
MEKILIEVNGTIHTFESIKEAAKYKAEFLEQTELHLNESPAQRAYNNNLIRDKFIENPNDFYKKYMEGQSIIEIEESLIDLCILGIDIDEYFACEKQSMQKQGLCGIVNYKNLCEKIREDKYVW